MSILGRVKRAIKTKIEGAKNEFKNPMTPMGKNNSFTGPQQAGMFIRLAKDSTIPVPGTSPLEKDAWKSLQLRRRGK